MTSEELETTRAEFMANRDYSHGAGSVTKARAFQSACVALIGFRPSRSQRFATGGPNLVDYDLKELRYLCDKVDAWLAANDRASQSNEPVQLSFEELRS